MKPILFLILFLSLGVAGLLGYEHYQETNPSQFHHFPKGSFEEKIYLDLHSLKSKDQLPKDIENISGYVLSDQRSDKTFKIPRSIFMALRTVYPISPTGKNEVEIVVFDAIELELPKKEEADSKNLIFQFSIIDTKTKNKVAEFARTYSVN